MKADQWKLMFNDFMAPVKKLNQSVNNISMFKHSGGYEKTELDQNMIPPNLKRLHGFIGVIWHHY